jgi:hypothetical protein
MRVIGRNTGGVRLFNVADNEHVVSAALVRGSVEVEDEETVEDEKLTGGKKVGGYGFLAMVWRSWASQWASQASNRQ